jgi:hypothetical protein
MSRNVQHDEEIFDLLHKEPIVSEQLTSYSLKTTLSSKLNGLHTINTLKKLKFPTKFSFNNLLACFFDTHIEKRSATRSQKNLPLIDNRRINI